jgi:hypothetical protein
LAVSHLDAPLALLHNQTPGAGSFLALELRGVHSNRDAIGATVTVTTSSGRSRIRQVVAGDGYQCSNHRRLVFGLGAEGAVSKVEIAWPSGVTQTMTDLGANSAWVVIEGRPDPIPLR